MSEQLWYYELLMEEFGPVPESEVQQLVDDGMLSAEDRVRHESSDSWITVAEFPDAVRAIAAGGPAVASDSPGNAPHVPDDRHSDLDIESFNFEERSATEDIERHSDLDIDSFNVAGDSDSPQPVATNPHKPVEETVEDEEEDEPTFYVQSLGHVLGPLTQDELVEMAIAGSLSRGDEIREGEDNRWIAVEAIPGLSEVILRQEIPTAPSTDADTKSPETVEPKKTETAKKTPRKKKPAPVRRKKKRKKKQKSDEFLQEIFAEVFNEEGKVREEIKSATPAAGAAPAAAATAAPGSSSDAQPATSAMAASTSEGGAISPAGSGTAAPSMPSDPPPMPAAPPPMASAPPAFVKPKAPPRPKKASSGGGGGFEMPEPKVLGMIGGGVAVLLILVGGFMGIIPLPGFGLNPDTFFREFAADFAKAKTGSIEDWNEFKYDYIQPARGLAASLAPKIASDPKAKRQQRAAQLIQKICKLPFDDKEELDKAFAEFNKEVAGG